MVTWLLSRCRWILAPANIRFSPVVRWRWGHSAVSLLSVLRWHIMFPVPKFHTLSHSSVNHLQTHGHTHIHTYMRAQWDQRTAHKHPLLLRVFEHVDACKDLECRSQFNVHGAHEVVLFQQEQRLSIDLLRAKLVCYLLTTCGNSRGRRTQCS